MSYYGCIYKISNKINGRIYIGQTTQADPYIRINCHFKKQKSKDLVYLSFLKNNKNREIFMIEILCSCSNLKNLNEMEKYYIQYFNCLAPNGYNLKAGGEQGGKCSPQVKLYMSNIRKGKPNKGFAAKGVPKSKEHRLSMSKSRKGFTSTNRINVQRNIRKKSARRLIAINIESKVEICFNSIGECARQLVLNPENISRVINNKQGRTQHKGWKFELIQSLI